MTKSDYLGPYLLGPNDTPENGIYTGDARELTQAIPDESIDLVFTDPVYQNISDYEMVARLAERVLINQGTCFVYYWPTFLPSIIRAMSGPLCFRWNVFDLKIGVASLDGGQYTRIMTRPAVVYSKNGHDKRFWLSDVVYSRPQGKSVNHRWSKNPSATIKWLTMIPAGLVLDPFTGGGTVPAVCKMLGRRYLAFEIEPDIAEMARERVRNTQPPLFVPQPEQLEMEICNDQNDR